MKSITLNILDALMLQKVIQGKIELLMPAFHTGQLFNTLSKWEFSFHTRIVSKNNG